MKAVLIVSHGSRLAEAQEEVERIAEALRVTTGMPVVCAYLDMAAPSIEEGVDACVRQGAGEIVVLLNFLNSGRHAERDVPARLQEAGRRHRPPLRFRITPPLCRHPHLVRLFQEMIRQALQD